MLANKVRWHLNHRIRYFLPFLDRLGGRLTVENAFGSPGDTLLTATFVRNLKVKYPRLNINVVTRNAELLSKDPNIETLNAPESFFAIRFSYLDILHKKDGATHVLAASFRATGVKRYDIRARVYLTAQEKTWARTVAGEQNCPVITINIMSRELVKVWCLSSWRIVIDQLSKDYSLFQLGSDDEPVFEGVNRLAGKLNMRESMAFLSQSKLHIGPDSFLMHAANGLGVPSIIIFGGSRTPANVGYSENINLYRPMPCGPCYIHTSHGQRCEFNVKCMEQISPDAVLKAVREKLAVKGKRPGPCAESLTVCEAE